jgi:hypothetical protein
MPLIVFALLAFSAEKPHVFYTAPAHPKKAKISEYDFNRWAVGAEACVANDDVNVRASANAKAANVGMFGLGTKVRVVKVAAKAEKLSDRVDLWYQVAGPDKDGKPAQGFVFGAALTPVCFEADLDGDTQKERIALSVAWDMKIRVRVVNPALSGDARMATFDLTPSSTFTADKSAGATASALTAADAGIPLLRVDEVPFGDGQYWRVYLSYGRPEGQPAAAPVLRQALQVVGMSDPPTVATFHVKFDAAAKTSTVTYGAIDTDSGSDKEEVSHVDKYTLEHGVYVQRK